VSRYSVICKSCEVTVWSLDSEEEARKLASDSANRETADCNLFVWDNAKRERLSGEPEIVRTYKELKKR